MTPVQAVKSGEVSTRVAEVSTGVFGFHFWMAVTAGGLSLLLAILLRVEAISVVNLHSIRFAFGCAVPIAAAAAYCHWAGYGKLCDGCLIVLWACLFFNLLQLTTYAAARTRMPFVDTFLMRADLMLGINDGAISRWVRVHSAIQSLSIWCYGLMPGMVFATVLVPPMAGKTSQAKRFVIATITAALLASCIQAAFPAIGPWESFHFTPYWNQSFEATEIAKLRSQAPFTANPDFTAGLIVFPSFHVALAVLCAFTLWPIHWLRFPAALVASLISIATVATGWHYAADGIGGVIVALFGIALSRRFIKCPTISPREK